MLAISLQRSQDSPLNVEISEYDGCPDILKAFNTAISHVERWQLLLICASEVENFRIIVDPLRSLYAPRMKFIKNFLQH
jgi:hypothetical protein